MGRTVNAHCNRAGEKTGPKAGVVGAVGVEAVEETKIEGIGKALDRNQTIEVGATRRVRETWAEESTSMFALSPRDLPN